MTFNDNDSSYPVHYLSVHAKNAVNSGLGKPMPAHVKRETFDEFGRLNIKLIAECYDDEWADRIAAALQDADLLADHSHDPNRC